MSNESVRVSSIPASHRVPFRFFAQALAEHLGDGLLGLSAFGGWVVEDPLFRRTPARSVAVLKSVDLTVLDGLGRQGVHFGKQNISAPLIMTPEYVRASCDTFPLELLEIQQVHARVLGEDHFADLKFERSEVRLECERELKSELIQLRQGLLRSAGKHAALRELSLQCAERGIRILRGVMHLYDAGETQQFAANLVQRAAELTGVPLPALEEVIALGDDFDFAGFKRFYAEVEALADHVDQMSDS